LSNGKALFDLRLFSNEGWLIQFRPIVGNIPLDWVALRTFKRTNDHRICVSQQEFRYTQQNSPTGASKLYFWKVFS